MKRSAALTPLSHDHHRAPYTAHRLSRAEDVSSVADLMARWREHGCHHFRALAQEIAGTEVDALCSV